MMANVSIDDVMGLKETPKALLVKVGGDQYWIPQTQITDDSEVWQEGDYGTLVITVFIARQKGIL